MRRRISRAQQTKNWCVGFSLPPPTYAGIHPTLYLFGFRASALNSRSPPYLPALIRGPPRVCGGLVGLRGLFVVRMLGLVVGFASFWGSWQTQKYQHFQVMWGGLASGPQNDGPKPQKAKVARFRVTNNLVSHSKGERSPRRGSCPSTWRCSSLSTNSLGLHRSSKQWCE